MASPKYWVGVSAKLADTPSHLRETVFSVYLSERLGHTVQKVFSALRSHQLIPHKIPHLHFFYLISFNLDF